tara:strand:+ start:1114 stop:1542 length:429 start_codon:yes stop_codon:yes gene_type:complete
MGFLMKNSRNSAFRNEGWLPCQNTLQGLAIIIFCLGHFGLAAFTAERRLKEIGVRKVLGSSEFGIIKILSTDFTQLVTIVIATPISYLITQRWLNSFVYHTNLSLWYFVGAGLITLVIAWLPVGIQTVKAAMVNPAKILRSE